MITIDTVSQQVEAELDRPAYDIRQLVKRNRNWLRRIRPDTLVRYRNQSKAVESLGRIVASDAISLHPIRRDKLVVGLGTIIKSLTVHHPGEDVTLTGRQIDYWTQPDLSSTDHTEITASLANLDGYRGTVLGLLTRAETERALGIPLYMQRVGERSHMEVVRAEDIFGISCIPDLQLYRTDV